VLKAVELVAYLEGEIGRAVDDIESLGEKTPVNGELKERAFDVKA